MNSPDINTEDYQAAIDYLSTHDLVDSEKIGIIGICGWGGIALNAAAIDPRIKVTIASTMYDMSRVTGNGYFDEADSEEARYHTRLALANQRTADYQTGTYKMAGGVPDTLPEDAPQFVKDYYAYYKEPRGYHIRSLNSNAGWAVQANTSFLNTRFLHYANEIRNAVMIIYGEKAHSRYFSEDAFKVLKGSNKELLIIPDAVHVDLYDNLDKIPFDEMTSFIMNHFND